MERDTTPPVPTEDELERFRREWQQELDQQRSHKGPTQRKGDIVEPNKDGVRTQKIPGKAFTETKSPAGSGSTGLGRSPPKLKSRTSDFDIANEPPKSAEVPFKSTSPKSPKRALAHPAFEPGGRADLREGNSSAFTAAGGAGRTENAASSSSSHPHIPASVHSPPGPSTSTSTSAHAKRNLKSQSAQAEKTAKAVEQYAHAVELEQMGKLNEALGMYRAAYRLDSEVERSYNVWVMEQEQNLLRGLEDVSLADPEASVAALMGQRDEVYTFRTTVQLDRDYVPVGSSVVEESGRRGDGAKKSMKGKRAEPSGTSTPIELGPGDRDDPLTRILLSWLDTAREEIIHPPPHDPASSDMALVSPSPFTPDRLPETIHDLYHHLPLVPLDEKYPILLSTLPEEVLENVLDFMDVTTLERFALVSKRLRVLTRGVGKWRTLCSQIYRPPITDPEVPLSKLVKRHGMDYRTTFLEERRVRYDGVYISVCHYVRPGQSELAWVNITHLITYHRFLRFYPDGTVIALLTTDHPVDVVHNIKRSLRAKGTLFGRWALSDWDPDMEKDRARLPVNELDPAWPSDSRAAQKNQTAAPPPPHTAAVAGGLPINLISISDMLEPGVPHPKYSFEMNLELRSAQRGRWNKLVMRDYQSVRLGTGEALGLSLKHQKPFFFSKVRSYSHTL